MVINNMHRRHSYFSQPPPPSPSTLEALLGPEHASGGGASRLDPSAQLTLMRYLQDLPDADIPPSTATNRYHTGRVPNSKSGDGKPRLLLMGQRR